MSRRYQDNDLSAVMVQHSRIDQESSVSMNVCGSGSSSSSSSSSSSRRFGFYDARNISSLASLSTVSVKSPTNFAQRF